MNNEIRTNKIKAHRKISEREEKAYLDGGGGGGAGGDSSLDADAAVSGEQHIKR